MAEQAPGPPAAPPRDEVLQQRVAALEQERAEFLKLKQQLEAEFNQKRAKFKELYVAKEEELRRQSGVLEGAQLERSSMLEQLAQARTELESIRTVAALSESSRQEAVDQVRSQWQEEVASLQAIMKETVCEYEAQWSQRLEQERAQWSQYREAAERQLGALRRRLAEGPEEEDLEHDMKKAQEDAEKLRSVVMPMEQEIGALKARLGRAEDRARELEASEVKELSLVLEAEKSCRTDLEMYVAVLNTQKAVLQEDAEKLRRELHQVCHKLELERQQHNQLKHTWQRANDQFLESQRLLMRDMQRMESRLSSEQLRQVEEAKRRDQEEEEEDEEERLSRVKQEEEEEVGDHTEPLEESLLEEPPASLSAHGSLLSLDPGVGGVACDSYRESLRRVQSTDSLGPPPCAPPPGALGGLGGLGGLGAQGGLKAKSSGQLEECDFGPLVGADGVSPCVSAPGVSAPCVSAPGVSAPCVSAPCVSAPGVSAPGVSAPGVSAPGVSAPRPPGPFLLTEDQEKAIKAMTPEQEETASLLSSISQPDAAFLSPAGYRLVSDSEWNLLQQEVKNAGRKLGRRCDMCSNYEKQLQAIQGQEAETRDQVKKLQVMLRQANDQLERTMREKQSLEDSVRENHGDTEEQVSSFMQRLQESELLLLSLQQAFSDARRSTQEQMVRLASSRQQVSDELLRLQSDNQSLQGKRRRQLQEQEEEAFLMPHSTQELQAVVLQLRGDVVALRTAADHLEEKLKAEILFLKEQNQAEQSLKEALEEALQLEIQGCKEEIAALASLKTELQRVKAEKEKMQRSLSEKTETLESIQGLRIGLERQLRELATAKSALQTQVFEEKDKAQRLQTELDVSEQVQKDFVKLSQTLQVQMERVRQADSLERVGVILNDTDLTDINQLPDT